MTEQTVVRVEVEVAENGLFDALTTAERETIDVVATINNYCEQVRAVCANRYPGADVIVSVTESQRSGSLPVMIMYLDGTYDDGADGVIDEAFWANAAIASVWDAQQFCVEIA